MNMNGGFINPELPADPRESMIPTSGINLTAEHHRVGEQPVGEQPDGEQPDGERPADAGSAKLVNPSRVIKRYSNRKLYDTKSSRYVTLPQIAELVRAGERVQILDNRTKEDKTEITLALIISEELRLSPRGIPLATLTALIKQSSEDGSLPGADTLSNFSPGFGTTGQAMTDSFDSELRARFEQWCAVLDSRVSALPDASKFSTMEAEIRRLNDRLAELERNLGNSRE
jgi:polyhydroxyalkanoate synthesis repressor PhaR